MGVFRTRSTRSSAMHMRSSAGHTWMALEASTAARWQAALHMCVHTATHETHRSLCQTADTQNMKGHAWMQQHEWTQQELNSCKRTCMDVNGHDKNWTHVKECTWTQKDTHGRKKDWNCDWFGIILNGDFRGFSGKWIELFRANGCNENWTCAKGCTWMWKTHWYKKHKEHHYAYEELHRPHMGGFRGWHCC